MLWVDVQDPTMSSCPPMDITVTRYDAANSSVPVFSDNSGIIDVRFTYQNITKKFKGLVFPYQ